MAAEIVMLHCPATGASAAIAAGLGFNCFRYTAMPGGRPVEVLYSHPEFAGGQQRPSGSGIPILFPFPGRIPGTIFEWEGKKYELDPGDSLGNAIHGFVHKRPWRVIEQSENHVVGQFHAWRDDRSLPDRWPADFRITATYTLQGSALESSFLLENPGPTPLPWGFGTHPYFRVPLGGQSADDCIVRLPVTARWELADMLPTGRRIDLPDAAPFQAGRRFGELKLDDVFTGLVSAGPNVCMAQVQDPNSQVELLVAWGAAEFRECVVYTPPHREAICIEPLTCAPSAAMLAARGIDAGWKVLQPGTSVRLTVRMEVREHQPIATGKK